MYGVHNTGFKRPLIRHFTWTDGHDDENGIEGWRMRGFEELDTVQGFGLAHDALEHFDATLGMDAEMKAFGAILWGRIDYGWRSSSRGRLTTIDDLGYDIQRFLEDDAEWCTPIPYSRLREGTTGSADWAEGKLNEFEATLIGMLQEKNEARGGDEPFCPSNADARIKAGHMVQWMRRGFQQAERRWAKVDGQLGFINAFDTIANHRYTTRDHGENGDELVIRIDGNYGGTTLKFTDVYDTLKMRREMRG